MAGKSAVIRWLSPQPPFAAPPAVLRRWHCPESVSNVKLSPRATYWKYIEDSIKINVTFGYNIYFSIKAFLVQKEMCLLPARKVCFMCFMCFMLSKCPHWRHVCFHPTLTSPCQKKSAGVRLAIKRSQPLQPWQPLEAPPPPTGQT